MKTLIINFLAGIVATTFFGQKNFNFLNIVPDNFQFDFEEEDFDVSDW